MLATALVERFSLQPHHEFVTARVLRPLGMTQATYVPSAALAAGTLAETFTPGPGSRRIPLWATDAGVRLNAGPGGLIASARDMARWARFWLGKAGAEADKAVPPAVRAECVRPQAVVHDDIGFKMPTTGATTYGFGWFQSSYKGHNVRFPASAQFTVMLNGRSDGLALGQECGH
jgi:CubicO group peptidase (beta-lactamase class C family)